MIVTLEPDAEPVAVQRELAGRGLTLSRAAVAAGAAGVMVETHPDPGSALSDASQALPLEEFAGLAAAVRGARS